jgi:hypothetical protein
MTMPSRPSLRLVLAAAAVALAAVPAAMAAPAATLHATNGCDLAVINDWLKDGSVDRTYAIPCYTQAIQRLNSMPDVKGYSSATDDIHDALLAAIRQDRGGGGSSGGSGPSGPSDGGSPPSSSPSGSNSGTGTPSSSGDKSVVRHLADRLGPSNAQSIPLPLLVLGGLAVLLLLAAFGTWLARRLQARRMTPAPAPARRP